MSAAIVDLMLVLIVATAWIAAIAFIRLKTALDRLHCITFVYFGCGLPLVVLAFAADGGSTRSWKIVLALLVILVAGASVNQAVARAIVTRDEAGEPN